MGFEIIEDITLADIALRICGRDLNEMFVSGAWAIISMMVENPESISRHIERDIRLTNSNLDLLLFEFLQEIIFYKDSESLLLIPDDVKISNSCDVHKLECRVYGETIKRDKHVLNVDVKAVTMHNLNVEKRDDIWMATLVLDV